MYRSLLSVIAVAVIAMVVTIIPAVAQDADQSVDEGGVFVEGWMGSVDARAAGNGMSADNASFSMEDGNYSVTTGPSVTYWNSENTASGSYTVMATFHEPAYMSLGGHPHPYGLFIGGNDLGTENRSLLYCVAYGNGKFIIRGFSPETFRMNGDRQEANDAVDKAEGEHGPVTQAISISVTEEKVECSINGTVVGSYATSEVVGEGKLKSTDGFYGVRVGHNVEVNFSGFHSMQN